MSVAVEDLRASRAKNIGSQVKGLKSCGNLFALRVTLVSGEIECSQKEAYGIQGGSARSILKNQQTPVMKCIRTASNAILQLGPELKGTETNVRVWEKGPPGIVVKFPSASPLREVVLFDEAGAPRVYEVTFR